MNDLVERTEKGRFVKGVSGNPNGRPKGSRNRIVEQKLALEEAVRDHVSPKHIRSLLKKMYDMAMEGDVSAGKYILDKFISNAKVEETADAEDKGIQIVVKNATFKVTGEETKPIEGESEVITDQE